jgi:undecaprenyl pyrophosphate phosphatase UppP
MAILLAISEVCARHKRTIDNVSLADAMIVGIAQVGALIPGVSKPPMRSISTCRRLCSSAQTR